MVCEGVCERLPVKCLAMILGNDIAGGKVMFLLEVHQVPVKSNEPQDQDFDHFSPACAVT